MYGMYDGDAIGRKDVDCPMSRAWRALDLEGSREKNDRAQPDPPLEHSEDLIEQDEQSQCSTDSIPSTAPAAQRAPFADYLYYAHRHFKIIECFSCFSDRTGTLRRDTTGDGVVLLLQLGSSF